MVELFELQGKTIYEELDWKDSVVLNNYSSIHSDGRKSGMEYIIDWNGEEEGGPALIQHNGGSFISSSH